MPFFPLEIRPAGVVESRVESRESSVEGREGKRERGGNWKNRGPVDQQPLSVSGTRRVPSARWAMHVQTRYRRLTACACYVANRQRLPRDLPGKTNYAQPLHPKLRTWRLGAESRACEHAPCESRGKRIMHSSLTPNFEENRRTARAGQIRLPACTCENWPARVFGFCAGPPNSL